MKFDWKQVWNDFKEGHQTIVEAIMDMTDLDIADDYWEYFWRTIAFAGVYGFIVIVMILALLTIAMIVYVTFPLGFIVFSIFLGAGFVGIYNKWREDNNDD